MKKQLLLIVLPFILWHQIFAGKTQQSLKKLYQTMGDTLIGMRKQSPEMQQHIYQLLDQLDKLRTIQAGLVAKRHAMKHELCKRTQENKILFNELANAKQELMFMQQRADDARRQAEIAQKAMLIEQKKKDVSENDSQKIFAQNNAKESKSLDTKSAVLTRTSNT